MFPAFSAFRCRVPWALALCVVFFVGLPLLGSTCALTSFVSPAWPTPWCLLPPPPPSPFVSRGFHRCSSVLCFFSPALCAPVVSGSLWFPAPGALGLGAVCCLFCEPPASWLPVRSRPFCVSRLAVGCSLVVAAPPPFLCLGVFVAAAPCAVFFFLRCAPPLSLAFSGFRPSVPWASRLCVVCFVGLPLLGSLCALASFVFPASPLAAPWWLLPPPPFCVSRFSSLPLGAVCCVLCRAVCPWVRCCAALLRIVPPRVVLMCAVLSCRARLVPLVVVPCPLALPVALGPCALRRCVLRCSPALCALCCVCFVVVCWCGLLFAALLCAACVLGSSLVRSLSSSLCAVLCFAVLVRLCCAVRVVRAGAGVWYCGALLCFVLFPSVFCGAVLGLVARGCLLVVFFGVGSPCLAAWSASLWLVLFAVVPCFPVSCSVVLCCRVVLCCCALLSFCGAVVACFALLRPVVQCCVVLLVGCAFLRPVVVSGCCGALSLPAGTHKNH